MRSQEREQSTPFFPLHLIFIHTKHRRFLRFQFPLIAPPQNEYRINGNQHKMTDCVPIAICLLLICLRDSLVPQFQFYLAAVALHQLLSHPEIEFVESWVVGPFRLNWNTISLYLNDKGWQQLAHRLCWNCINKAKLQMSL